VDFLLDVNASGAVARWLIDRGHNVAEVGQTDPRMRDDKILNWAVRENRIIWGIYLTQVATTYSIRVDGARNLPKISDGIRGAICLPRRLPQVPG